MDILTHDSQFVNLGQLLPVLVASPYQHFQVCTQYKVQFPLSKERKQIK